MHIIDFPNHDQSALTFQLLHQNHHQNGVVLQGLESGNHDSWQNHMKKKKQAEPIRVAAVAFLNEVSVLTATVTMDDIACFFLMWFC